MSTLLGPVFPASRVPLGRAAWSVGALLQAVGASITDRFAVCTVRGEISGFSRPASGHCYFSLKDDAGEDAALRCAMFRRAASLLSFAPTDGSQVEVRGRLGIFAPRGELQLVVESMQPAGAGALYEQFLRLKAKLEAEGLFDASRKRRPAAFPQRIGIVTSPDGAALHDVVSSIARRSPHVVVVIYPSPVQGVDAPQRLADAIALAGRRGEVDTLLVCRGGGSLEDLWAFNDERVVRAIGSCPIAVICGVGHETDTTLADYAADLRAPTPTAAAELATPATIGCLDRLSALSLLLQRRTRQLLDLHAQRLDTQGLRLARPAQRLQREQRRLDSLAQRLVAARVRSIERTVQRLVRSEERLQAAATMSMQARRQRIDACAARLSGVDPQRVLRRGYAWLADSAGWPVTGLTGVTPGAVLHARLHDGVIDTRVMRVTPLDASSG